MIRAVIVDDEPDMLEDIQVVVNRNELDIAITGTAANGIERLRVVKSERPDILLTDTRVAGIDGSIGIAA